MFKEVDEMAKCANCQQKWSAKDVLAIAFSKDGKACPNCNEQQYIASNMLNMMTVLGYISIVFIVLFPFLIKLSSKKE